MNFIEAVKALKEGKCEGITNGYCVYIIKEEKLFNKWHTPSIVSMLANYWKLVDPVKNFEEVQIVRWLHIPTNEISNIPPPLDFYKDFVKLTGTVKQEIKPKVKRKVELNYSSDLGFALHQNGIPTGATVIAEWEE